MKPVEIIGIVVFGALLVSGLALGLWQRAKQRQRTAEYASARGWTFLKPGDAGLYALLDETTPHLSWSPDPTVLVSPGPPRVYFFGYALTRHSSSMSPSYGYACVAERGSNPPRNVVAIEPRLPLLGGLTDDAVETGSDEFRREYSVSCRSAGAAHAVVNAEVQRILLDHAARSKWGVIVFVAGRGVVVGSPHAKPESEWEHLIALATKLRTALP